MLVLRPFACAKPPPVQLLDRDDELSRRGRFPAHARHDKDLYRVKLSLERFMRRASIQHKLVCIAIRRMEKEHLEQQAPPPSCTGELCDSEADDERGAASFWVPNASWIGNLDDDAIDM